jgi:hypothetical protein
MDHSFMNFVGIYNKIKAFFHKKSRRFSIKSPKGGNGFKFSKIKHCYRLQCAKFRTFLWYILLVVMLF